MEKDHLPIQKVVKNLPNKQRPKSWARVRIAVSSCPSGGHMYR